MKRLLLIDSPVYHNPHFLEMLEKEGGYEVILATSQEDYEAYAREYSSALFADLRIPGKEATKEKPWNSALAVIKDLSKMKIPVLALERLVPKEICEEAIALGARILKKPLHIDNILHELNSLEDAFIGAGDIRASKEAGSVAVGTAN